MKRISSVILILCLFIPLTGHAANVAPDEVAISLGNLLRHQIVDRFQNFRDKVKFTPVKFEDGQFVVCGILTSDDGRPMDLTGQLVQAMEGTGIVYGVLPSVIKRFQVNDNNRVAFKLLFSANLDRIPKDLTAIDPNDYAMIPADFLERKPSPIVVADDFTRESKFHFVVPPERLAPTETLIILTDVHGEKTLDHRLYQPGETIDLEFSCTGPTTVQINFDGILFKSFSIP